MAEPPEGQSCGTCAFLVKGTCRRKMPEVVAPSRVGWLTCEPDGWCFNWKADVPPPS